MANHCCEVTCADCGETWCVRGCGDRWSDAGWKAFHLEKLERRRKVFTITPAPGEQCSCGSANVFFN